MSEIEQVELSIQQAKDLVNARDMADKLSRNREFKKLILEGYFEKEAARLVSLSGDSNMLQQRDEIFDAIKAISHFRQFMQNTMRMGDVAAQELAEQNETLDELRAAEGDEE